MTKRVRRKTYTMNKKKEQNIDRTHESVVECFDQSSFFFSFPFCSKPNIIFLIWKYSIVYNFLYQITLTLNIYTNVRLAKRWSNRLHDYVYEWMQTPPPTPSIVREYLYNKTPCPVNIYLKQIIIINWGRLY